MANRSTTLNWLFMIYLRLLRANYYISVFGNIEINHEIISA